MKPPTKNENTKYQWSGLHAKKKTSPFFHQLKKSHPATEPTEFTVFQTPSAKTLRISKAFCFLILKKCGFLKLSRFQFFWGAKWKKNRLSRPWWRAKPSRLWWRAKPSTTPKNPPAEIACLFGSAPGQMSSRSMSFALRFGLAKGEKQRERERDRAQGVEMLWHVHLVNLYDSTWAILYWVWHGQSVSFVFDGLLMSFGSSTLTFRAAKWIYAVNHINHVCWTLCCFFGSKMFQKKVW